LRRVDNRHGLLVSSRLARTLTLALASGRRSTAIHAVSGGRSWRAHRECTRINIELTIL